MAENRNGITIEKTPISFIVNEKGVVEEVTVIHHLKIEKGIVVSQRAQIIPAKKGTTSK
jgi:hypothetical protein